MSRTRNGARRPVEVLLVEGREARLLPDELAVEQPLEIRLLLESGAGGSGGRTLAITMRTPGADGELAAGFLYAEGIVEGRDDIVSIAVPDGSGGSDRSARSGGPDGPGGASGPEGQVPGGAGEGVVVVALCAGLEPDLAPLERHFTATAACGVCGRTSLAGLLLPPLPPPAAGPRVDPEVIHGLPATLRRAQGVFQATGGLHAAALFDAAGRLLAVREDVGRHNALDKLVGWALLTGRLPLAGHLVVVSGRASFELVQKCLRAGAPVLCAVSAPSSLAVSLAGDHGATLIGFLRDGRFNVYCGAERVAAGAHLGQEGGHKGR